MRLSPWSFHRAAEKMLKSGQYETRIKVTFPLSDEAYTPYSLVIMRDIIYEVIKRQDDIFSIIDLGTDTLIGCCLMFDIAPLNRRAMLGMFSFNERA